MQDAVESSPIMDMKISHMHLNIAYSSNQGDSAQCDRVSKYMRNDVENAGWMPTESGSYFCSLLPNIAFFDAQVFNINNSEAYQKSYSKPSEFNPKMGTANSSCVAAGRVSYTYGLNGPSLSVDTACSSSLVGTHLAMQSLSARECITSFSVGVNLTLAPDTGQIFKLAGNACT